MKIEIFANFHKNLDFSKIFDQNLDWPQISSKIDIVQKIGPNLTFLKFKPK